MITARAQMLPTTGPTGKAAAVFELLAVETVKSAADAGDELVVIGRPEVAGDA
jgi:hypothetical protein